MAIFALCVSHLVKFNLYFFRIFVNVQRLERYKSFDEMKSKESTGTLSSPEEKKIAEFFRLLRQSAKPEVSGD